MKAGAGWAGCVRSQRRLALALAIVLLAAANALRAAAYRLRGPQG